MICKFCGSTLDDNEFECPYCGHKTDVQPQVEIYDNYDDGSGGNNYQNDYDDYDEPEEEYRREPKRQPRRVPQFKSNSNNMKNNSNFNIGQLPLFVTVIVCAALSVVNLISLTSVKKSVEELEQSMLMQFYQLQSANSEILNQVSILGGDITNVTTSISQSNDSKNITITRQPSSDAVYLGRGSDDDVSQNSPIFYAEADGNISNVEWQVKVGDEWVTISWDRNSNNDVYGLHIYNDIGPSHTKTQLCSHNVTNAGFATYRCVFTDSYGSKSTDPVTLSEKPKD